MTAKFKVIALSSLDIEGDDVAGEPELLYPEAIRTAQELSDQGKAFCVRSSAKCTEEQRQAFRDLGAVG